jgi:hypothetical protein
MADLNNTKIKSKKHKNKETSPRVSKKVSKVQK